MTKSKEVKRLFFSLFLSDTSIRPVPFGFSISCHSFLTGFQLILESWFCCGRKDPLHAKVKKNVCYWKVYYLVLFWSIYWLSLLILLDLGPVIRKSLSPMHTHIRTKPNGVNHTLVPEVFFCREENIKRQTKKWWEKTSGYPQCESHCHTTIGVNQHHEID